jgi:hypothetical protein
MGMSRGILTKIRHIQFHGNVFSISRVVTWRKRDRNFKGNKRYIFVVVFLEIQQTVTRLMYMAADCCSQRDAVNVTLSVLLYNTLTVQILYKLYSLQLICIYSNYTEAATTCSAEQQHSTLTVQILYKLYTLQLNCTYSSYTEAAATCSAAQQHSTFTVQILYKLYSLQLNFTYSSYTEAAATCSAAQQHTNFQADVFWSEVQKLVWNYIATHNQRLDPSHSRCWLQEQWSNLTVIWNKWMLQGNWRKLKSNRSTVCVKCLLVWRSVSFIYFYCNWLRI